MTETESRRRIGDILLELGFVTPDALARASAEQDDTGQPLGQILVEHGAITRLELASALAEQWADHASISPLPVPSAMPRVEPQPHDEDGYAARLQEAVAELAQRVETAAPKESSPDGRVTELAERIEATVARTQRLEATVATLAESLDGVTGGVEEAFGVLQSGMAGLALDLARIDTTIAELRAEPSPPPADTSLIEQHVEELRAAVEQLAERPFADEDARRRADELAAEVALLPGASALESVRETLGTVERRVDELAGQDALTEALDAQRTLLTELQAAVVELQERPAGDPGLDGRLARIEAELASAPADVPAVADLEALAARLEKTREGQEEIALSLETLEARLDDVARREPPEAVPPAEVDEIRARVASLAAELEHVRETVPSARVAELAGELERLAAGDGLRALESRLQELETHLGGGLVTQAELTEALDSARDDLRPPPVEPDPRVEALAEEIEALRLDLARAAEPDPRVEEVAEGLEQAREGQTQIGSSLEALGARLDEVARREQPEAVPPAEVEEIRGKVAALASDLERVRETVPSARVAELAGELERLAAGDGLRALEARLQKLEAGFGVGLVTSDDAAHALDVLRSELTARVEEIAHERQHREALAAELEALRERVGVAVTPEELDEALARARNELEATPAPAADADARFAHLSTELEGLRDDLRRQLHEAPRPAEAEELERLAERLAAIETRPEQIVEAPKTSDTAQLEAALAALGERLEVLEPLSARVDDLTHAITTPAVGAPAAPGAEVEDELERTRMTIERLSLHLGEHDRALAEMRGSRAMAQRLEDLAASVEALAANGMPSGAPVAPQGESSYARRSLEPDIEMRAIMRRLEDLEEGASVGREKLMNRLERIASSIDWRLQRLEGADPGQEQSKG